jgi:hypothetical protein
MRTQHGKGRTYTPKPRNGNYQPIMPPSLVGKKITPPTTGSGVPSPKK